MSIEEWNEEWKQSLAGIEKRARRERAANPDSRVGVFSVVVGVPHASGNRVGGTDQVSEVITRIEKHGWILNQATAFATGGGAHTSNQTVLLIFRAA